MERMVFNAGASCQIPKGTVFLGPAPEASDRRGRDWIGREVLINGEAWEIRGIESFTRAAPLRVGEMVGLLVVPKG